MSLTIRPAKPADREFILSLAPRFVEAGAPPWRSADDMITGTAQQLERAMNAAGDRSVVLVAEMAEGSLAGFSWVVLVDDFYTSRVIGKVSEIAVARSRLGVGRALMEASEVWARERGAHLMTLNVLENNESARAFYAEMGYAPEYSMFAKKL